MNVTNLWDPYADFNKSVLPNGLSVYHSFWDRPWLKVGFVIHSGSFADIGDSEGTAHFVEHMLSKNIDGVSYDDVDFFFRSLGGCSMLGSTGPLSTSYWFSIPADPEVLKRSLDIFGSMLLGGSFEKDLERERDVILCEFGNRFPFGLMYDLYQMHKRQMLYEGIDMRHYKGNLGDKQSIASISKDDLEQFHDINYVPQNMSIVVVGNMQSEEFIGLLNKSMFSKNVSGVRRPLPQACLTAPKPKETMYDLKISDMVKDTAINMASYETYFACPGNSNMKMLELFQNMMSYILDAEVRQRFGSTYDIGVEIVDYVQVIEMRMRGRINPDLIDNMHEIVKHCLMRLKSENDLFDKFKSAKLNRYKLLDVNGQQLMKNAMEDLETRHRIMSLCDEIDLFEEVKFVDVCVLADYVADSNNRWTLIERP